MNASGKAIISVLLALSICLLPLYNNPLVYPTQAGITIYVDASATGANDGTSWQDAFTSLQSALTIAVSDDEVWVAAGTYLPGANRAATFQLISGVSIYGGFPVGGGDFGSRDPEANRTILSGDIGTPGNNADNSYHVVTGSGVDNTAMLDGFTVSNGNANSTSPNHGGGGLYNDFGSPFINNVTFSNNQAQFGGGIYNANNSSSIIQNSEIISNSVSVIIYAAIGGGIHNSDSYPILKNVDIIGNTASGVIARGGGYLLIPIYCSLIPHLRITLLQLHQAVGVMAVVVCIFRTIFRTETSI